MTGDWLVPTLVYVLGVGALGVTGKLALRHLRWPDLLQWMAVGYVIVIAVLVALGEITVPLQRDTWWAIAAALCACSSLVILYVALGLGEASKVVPVTAAYPAVTLVLSAAVLSEALTVARVGGVALVLAGAVVVTAAR